MGDRLASPHDREVLAPVLDRVEEISKVPSRIRRRHIRHDIRLSDMQPRDDSDALDSIEAQIDQLAAGHDNTTI